MQSEQSSFRLRHCHHTLHQYPSSWQLARAPGVEMVVVDPAWEVVGLVKHEWAGGAPPLKGDSPCDAAPPCDDAQMIHVDTSLCGLAWMVEPSWQMTLLPIHAGALAPQREAGCHARYGAVRLQQRRQQQFGEAEVVQTQCHSDQLAPDEAGKLVDVEDKPTLEKASGCRALGVNRHGGYWRGRASFHSSLAEGHSHRLSEAVLKDQQ